MYKTVVNTLVNGVISLRIKNSKYKKADIAQQ